MEKNDQSQAARVENPDVAFEPRDVNPRSLFMIGVGILVAAAVIHFAVAFLFGYFAARDARRGLRPSTLVSGERMNQPPEPRLQISPARDLEELRRTEREKLSSYGWADEKAGAVRIPVERAMALLVQRGLPPVTEKQNAAETLRPDNQPVPGTGQKPAVSNNGRIRGKR